MGDIIYKIVFVVLFVLGVCIAYVLGKTSEMGITGTIEIEDSDDTNLQGKVTFIFDDKIEELIKKRYAVLKINNHMTLKKYNHDNEETK